MFPWQRNKPFPYELIVQPDGGTAVGVMVKPGPNGQMVGRQSRRLDAINPTTYDYGALNPYKEKPFTFGPILGGVGEPVQVGAIPNRYKYARRADLSIGGQRRLAPSFHVEMVAAGQFVNQVIVGRHNGADTLFALIGRYIYRFDPTGPAWILSRDSGGAQHIQAVQFKGDAVSDRLWVTTSTNELWGYDGSVWAKAVLPVGASATFVEKVGTELHIFASNQVRVCTSGDPMLAVSWGGVIYVGDFGKNATWMRALDDQVFYFKDDGIFTITTDQFDIVQANDLFPELRHGAGPWRGRNAAPWKGYLWFAFGNSFYRMTGGNAPTLEPIGIERILGLDERLQADPIAFVGHQTWFGYFVTDNDLWKFGEWTNAGATDAQYTFADAWNGSLADWSTKSPTSIYITDVPTGVPWLLIGFDDGSIEYAVLPSTSPDPADDSACEFVTGGTGEESYVDWPDHHAMAQADNKRFRAFTATGPRLDASNYVSVSYRTDPDDDLTELGTNLDAAALKVTTPGSVAGHSIQVRENLHGTRTSTPKVESVVLFEQIRPDRQIEYTATALARNRGPRRDGSVDRRTAEQIRQALQATAGAGPTTVYFADGTQQVVDFVDYGEALPNPGARYGLEWEIPMTFVQWIVNTVLGTWDRALSHTWDDAAAYSWDQTARW